jgi:hypothetical protein
MEKRKLKNISASVRARLLNLAKAEQKNFNNVLLQYFQERFLYRLSVSPDPSQAQDENFILKGALLFLLYDAPRLRPTKDIDLLGRAQPNDLENIRTIIQQIAQIEAPDGVVLTKESATVEKIKESDEYEGVRVKIEAFLTSARQTLQIDIGFGDQIVPGPLEIEFPVLLDQPAPRIKGYSKESVISEKFEAIVRFNFLTSRMKDFYDILFLATHESFQMPILRQAIDATFHRRMTPLDDISIIFTEEFKVQVDKQEQWTAFLRRNHLESFERFASAVEHLRLFLEPVLKEPSDVLENLRWSPDLWLWQS